MDGLEITKRGESGIEPAQAATGYTAADFAISDTTRQRIIDGVPPNTRRAYERQWGRFAEWCAERGRIALPATAHTYAEYVRHLTDKGFAPATIEQAMGAIRTHHRLAGHKQQPDSEAALVVLRGYRRSRAESGQRNQRKAPPVTIAALRAMVAACDLSTPIGVRDQAVLVFGLAMMGRRSELAGLHRDDVTQVEDGLEICVRTSKTDKDSRGAIVAVPRGSHPLTDPVKVWRTWLDVLDDAGEHGGRLLRRVDRHGNIGPSLHANSVNDIVRRLARRAELENADQFTAHSLRAGGATVAYAAGVPVSTIAEHGRWSLKSPVLLGYIRAVDRWRDNAMRNVGL
jgi:integrase